MIPTPANGLVTLPSSHSLDETLRRLTSTLRSKGITVFDVIDHSGEAEKAGLTMPPTRLVIFGSPKAGTPLMLATPSVAIDLPLKILVSQDSDSKVWVSYNSPAYLQQRHDVPSALMANIDVVEAIASHAAE
jgi:uncharacterized protein (DUF302 family)